MRRFLTWEVCWTAAEMAGVSLGLYLLLALRRSDIALPVLFAVVTLSILVRTRHYSSGRR